MHVLARLALVAPMLTPTAIALACGGLFCNASNPVEQTAERILFIADGGMIHMHVQLTYQGPPTDFGWLLPVPRGVETGLSSAALFAGLDSLHSPAFQLNYEYEEGCEYPYYGDEGGGGAGGMGGGGGEGGGGGGEPPPMVQVLSREAVGPYDRAILRADNVEVLRDWLDENEFGIPRETDAKLSPYIAAGADFVAIKLLADAQTSDIVPLRLSFPADRPAIPIVPTAVAATPDMGIIVHVLGDERAIPLNYLHVEINEAAIDWRSGGNNYRDVVSEAADEAGGKAFATDYAGPVDPLLVNALEPLSDRFLQAVEALESTDDLDRVAWPNRNDPDILRVFAGEIGVPEFADPRFYFGCPRCFNVESTAVDGEAVAARLREEVQPPREHLTEQLARHSYLTRLYSTMSPAEMDMDPIFSFNPDLVQVQRLHVATLYVPCDDTGYPDEAAGEIRLADGRAFPVGTETIRRQNGERIRGEVPAARRIDQLTEAGQPMYVDGIEGQEPWRDHGVSGGGCACDQSDAPVGLGVFGLLLAIGARRRRRAGA